MRLVLSILTLAGSALFMLGGIRGCATVDSDDIEIETSGTDTVVEVGGTVRVGFGPDLREGSSESVLVALILSYGHTLTAYEVFIDFLDGQGPQSAYPHEDIDDPAMQRLADALLAADLYDPIAHALFFLQADAVPWTSGAIEVIFDFTVVHGEGLPVTFNRFAFGAGTLTDLNQDPVDPWRLLLVGESLGACCLSDNTCVGTTQTNCVDNLGGVYQGVGTTCGGWLACCDPAGVCYMTDALCCLANGDTPQGAGTACTTPDACCFPDGTCQMLDPLCCIGLGGEPKGPGTMCLGLEACCFADGTCQEMDAICCINEGGEPKGPGTVCLGTQACCFPDGTCEDMDILCCENMGGTPQGAGTACTFPQACCLGDGSCVMVDPFCCDELGGAVYPGGACGGVEGCCIPDPEVCLAACVTVDALCCVEEFGGTPMGFGTACGTDSDEDTIDDLCDICEGVDDYVFCPECKDAIPTVSVWGLVVLALLLMTAGKIYFGRRRAAAG